MQYNGECFEYDSLGNPTKYRDKHLEWKYSRQLAVFDSSTFNYNADGIRISKTYNGITTHFYLDGTKILAQDNGNILSFKYGVDGVIGFTYEGVGEYFYKKNIFGDIIGILNTSGDEIAKYTYDAWGNHKTLVLNNNEYVDILSKISYTTEGSNNKLIAELNPFRYRGYYYDVETGLYYLNTRYYDPQICRFINADNINILYQSKDLFDGLNLFNYCNSNPCSWIDKNGNYPINVTKLLNRYSTFKNIGKNKTILANIVTRVSYSQSLINDPFVAFLLGNITYTVSTQGNDSGMFYAYNEFGIGGTFGYGVGLNLGNILGIEVGVTSGDLLDLGINASISIGSFSVSGSIGIAGIGIGLGYSTGNTTQSINGTIGWGTIAFAAIISFVPGGKIIGGLALLLDWLF